MKKLFAAKALRALFAFLLSFAMVGGAFALSNDRTRLYFARAYSNFQPWYYRATVNFNDPNILTWVPVGGLATNDFIKAIDCHVTTAFNAGSTNTITFGTSQANANEIVASGITAGTPGVYHLTSAAGLGVAVTSAGASTIYAKYAQTGTSATAGAVTCVIEVVSNNDM